MVTLLAAVELFLADLASSGLRAAALATVDGSLRLYLDYLNSIDYLDADVSVLSAESALAAIAWAFRRVPVRLRPEQRGLARLECADMWRALCAFGSWLERVGVLPANPLGRLPSPERRPSLLGDRVPVDDDLVLAGAHDWSSVVQVKTHVHRGPPQFPTPEARQAMSRWVEAFWAEHPRPPCDRTL